LKNENTAKSRPKRQANCPYFPTFNIPPETLNELQSTLCQNINNYVSSVAQNFEDCCNSCYTTCLYPDVSAAQSCSYNLVCIFQQPRVTLLTELECSGYSTRVQQALISYNSGFCPTPTTAAPTPSILDVVTAAAGTAAVIGAITLLIQDPVPFLTPQGIPLGNPLPGTPGIPLKSFQSDENY
jgi:hypothetical protein